MFSMNAYASSPTAIEIQMMQNRVIKSTNAEVLVVSICDAIMDMNIMARCFGATTLGYMNKNSTSTANRKKLIDEATFQFYAVSSVSCGRSLCQQVATINLNKVDEKSFKLNIKIIDGQQPNFDVSTYKKYFDAIGNSLFLNKTGVELGALSE